MKNAEKKIKEYLNSLGYKFVNIKGTGLFNTGDFKGPIIEIGTFTNENGKMSSVHYRYLYFKDKEGRDSKVTVKINWHLLKKTRLEFCPEIKKTQHYHS